MEQRSEVERWLTGNVNCLAGTPHNPARELGSHGKAELTRIQMLRDDILLAEADGIDWRRNPELVRSIADLVREKYSAAIQRAHRGIVDRQEVRGDQLITVYKPDNDAIAFFQKRESALLADLGILTEDKKNKSSDVA